MTEIALPLFNKAENERLFTVKSVQSLRKFHGKKSIKKLYRSGAWYIGNLNGTQKCGWGQFQWSNGGFYEGNFVENKRHGQGKYIWNDGSVYVGTFQDNLRHGYGELTWPNEEIYHGDFFEDKRRGVGVYTWPDGSKYEGYFKNDKKCGYGVFNMKNGDMFEGIYDNDCRCGPGILTYKNTGKQDVGIWKSSMLAELCLVIEDAFLFENFTVHGINAGENISQKIKNSNSARYSAEVIGKTSSNDVTSMKTVEDIVMPCSFPYEQILNGVRGLGSTKGHLEEMSEELLKVSSIGNVKKLKEILESGIVNPDVTDKTGHFAVLAAAVNCHLDVLDCLLDNGADINLLTKEGLSALSACHLLLYTEENFLPNIAESMPKENLFNTVEIERRTGNLINRNDRKVIMSIYETLCKPYTSAKLMKQATNKGPKNKRNNLHASFIDSRSRTMSNKTVMSISDEEEEEDASYDLWKLNFYQKSIDHVKEVESINKTFKEVMLNPHLISFNKRKCSDTDSSDDNDANMLNPEGAVSSANQAQVEPCTTVASICGYDCLSVKTNQTLASNANKCNVATMKNLLNIERKPHVEQTIHLLLKRGADPNASELPLPVLFFAVKSADPRAVHALLKQNAQTCARMKHQGLSVLHLAVALPCKEGIEITKLLLHHGADPNLRDSYLEGRTPLHIVCCREDDYKQAVQIARLLLEHHANPDILCAGNSALSLAIASGNDLIVDLLLEFKADASLKLSHGLGSALCVAVSFQAERHRSPNERMKLIEKLVDVGADFLTPVRISDKYPPGTVIDYAHNVFIQDRRIACTPYHALSSLERECYNARKHMLECLGDYLRAAAMEKEAKFAMEAHDGEQQADSIVFHSPQRTRKPSQYRSGESGRDEFCGLRFVSIKMAGAGTGFTKRLRYCYECGRSIGVRLSPCTRCKEVFYCSKNCKVKAWNVRHREECIKLTGQRAKSGSPKSESPTPTTDVTLFELKKHAQSPVQTEHDARKTKKAVRKKESGFLPQLLY